MDDVLLSPKEAAARLRVTVTTLYDWLGQSDRGLLFIRGQSVTIDYFQGGPQDQGRIRVPESEVQRIHELMRERPRLAITRRRPLPTFSYPGINVPLGRPDS